jgi:5-hydroxyisourate hydrolase
MASKCLVYHRKPSGRVRKEGVIVAGNAGRLTTHVLDTATGKPAAGLSISLYRIEGDRRQSIKSVRTNADGRCDAPLLSGDEFATGEYELVFAAGDYLRRTGVALPKPAFLDTVPIRFGMAEQAHYHVPLLISPYGYSTYRGS